MSQDPPGRTRQERTNRLADEKSPYLQQHARNPVDWYPWGREAFEAAKAQDKPVFLSIGYSTCHWCHVMAHESFEDEDVARLMNEAFVNIKLDREERPDLDAAYMQVCQMMTGAGGWPLTIIMTPDQEPFYAATYLPKDSRHGMPGMLQLVPAVQDAWHARRDEIAQTTQRIKGHLGRTMLTVAGPALGDDAFDQAAATLAQNFDPEHGGFGSAPKFPSPHQLLFLLRHGHRTQAKDGARMATKTLQAMRRGGIHDHVGGGFHRYSVDARWHVPHFEKMLYDQAMIVLALTEAVEATGDASLAETARNVLSYVKRDLRDPGGAFYSSEDADSEGEEGRFYVWTQDEVQALLGDDAPLVLEALGVRPQGNWVEEATGRSAATNILHRPVRLDDLVRRHGREPREIRKTITGALDRLRDARDKRPRPHRDEKILTDWNGLMIAALAKAARVLKEPQYAKTAREALAFVTKHLTTTAGDLLHRWVDGEAAIDGFLDDHAFLTWGLIELHQTTQDHDLLEQAVRLQEATIRRFWDDKDGGFFFTSDAHETPLGRRKEVFDSAVPSGQSVALENLVRLSHLTGRTDFDDHADRLVRTYSLPIEQAPHAFTHFLSGAMHAAGPAFEIVIAGEPDGADTQALQKAAWASYTPNKVVLTRPGTGTGPTVAPYAAEMTAIGSRAAAYVCQDHACQRPVTDPQQLVQQLTAGAPEKPPTG